MIHLTGQNTPPPRQAEEPQATESSTTSRLADTNTSIPRLLHLRETTSRPPRWQRLQLKNKQLDGASLAALLPPGTWPALRHLDLSSSCLDARAAQALTAWDAAVHLEVLSICHNQPEAARDDNSPIFFLESWDLHARQWWEANLSSLAIELSGPPLTALHTLELSGTLLSTADILFLIRTPSSLRLKRFAAANCGLSEKNVMDMFSGPSSALALCEDLDIAHNPFRVYTEMLSLNQNDFGPYNLRKLDLSRCQPVRENWLYLRHVPLDYQRLAVWLVDRNAELRELRLAGSLTRFYGIGHALRQLKKLEALDIRANQRLDDHALADIEAPATLRQLAIAGTRITPAAAQRFAPEAQLDGPYWQALPA